VNGALYGGTYGLSTGDASKGGAGDIETRLNNAGKDAAFGTALGGAIPTALAAGKGLANMVTRSTSPSVVNGTNALHEFTGGPIDKVDTTEYVPGSKPTLANAAAYAGDPNAGNVAALEKTLSESKAGGSELYNQGFVDNAANNNQARRSMAMDLAGTPDDITTAQRSRSTTATQLLGNEAKRLANPGQPQGTVWQNNKPSDPSSVLDYIKAVKQGPASGNTGLVNRLDTIQDLLEKKGTNPQYIYESVIKPQLNDILESTNPFTASQATSSQLPYLKQIHSMLSDVVANAAPDFNAYKAKYSQDSKAIERQQALQSLKLVNPEVDESYPTLSKVNSALAKVQQGRSNIDSTDPWKSLAPDDINKLQNLQKDLARDQSAQKLIATKGSPTSQNLQFVNKVKSTLGTQPPGWPRAVGGLLGSAAGGTAGALSGLPVGWTVGMTTAGAGLGERAGNMLADKIAERGAKTAVDVSDLLLNPRDYVAGKNSSSSGIVNNLNPFNPNGKTGKAFLGTNYGPGVGYATNRLLQLGNPGTSH
jgi:hypothetical protein